LDCFKDFVQDGENGLVFDHHAETAVADLAKLIQRLIADPDLYQRLSEQGALSAKKFSAEAISEQYLTVLNNILFAHQTGFNPQTMKVENIIQSDDNRLKNNDLHKVCGGVNHLAKHLLTAAVRPNIREAA
jgi:molecular chaperone GrpE (heat shock protein)